MAPLVTAFVVFFASIGAAILGFRLQRPLRIDQQNESVRASARVATSQVALLTFIVLGMVTAAARETYNTGNNVVASMALEAIELDRLLDAYGDDAADARAKLKQVVRSRIDSMESDESYAAADELTVTGGSLAEGVYGAVEALRPTTDIQRDLRQQALAQVGALTRARWSLTVKPSTTPSLFLWVVGLWIALQTVSFGLFGERNRAVYTAIVILSVVFASAAFLLVELEGPFSGYLRVSVVPLQQAEQLLGR